MKIGINPLTWMNSDFPEMGSHISLDQCLSEAALAGYVGIEIEDRFREDPIRTSRLLAMRGLNAIGGWLSTELLDEGMEATIEAVKRHCDVLDALRAEVVVLCETSRAVHRNTKVSLSKRPRLSEAEWSRLCDGLDHISELIGIMGFKPTYHHHMGCVVQDAEDIDRLMRGTELLPLLFDTGHLSFAGADPLEVLSRHGHRINHVHCKGVRPSVLQKILAEDAPFSAAVLQGAFTVPGDCEQGVDFQAVLRYLVRHHYKGWIVVEAEQDPRSADPFTYAELGARTLKALLTQERFAVWRERQLLLDVSQEASELLLQR